jgi:alpha-D-xyloside xylohydrolase
MGPVKQYTDEPIDAPMALTVYPGADGAFTVYEDDGKSFAHKNGDFMRVAMTWSDASRRLRITLAPGSRMRAPNQRQFEVRVAGARTSRTITFNGSPVTVTL